MIVGYDSQWPVQAAAEMGAIRAALGHRLAAIEHIGSTSVPGLAAKPIIDLMAGLRTLDDAIDCVPLLATLEYSYVPEFEAQMPERRYFRKSRGETRTHHLHMVVIGGAFWQRHLVFRDALRADPDLASEYAALKRRLAEQYSGNMVGYTEAKTAFIQAIELRDSSLR